MNKSTQEQYVSLAWTAASRAAALAGDAENAARIDNDPRQAEALAAAGALWADVARTYTSIAAVLPDPLPELPTTGPTEY